MARRHHYPGFTASCVEIRESLLDLASENSDNDDQPGNDQGKNHSSFAEIS